MINLGIPRYIILWVQSFLKNRKFIVNVNQTLSEPRPIQAGVPQGAVISPILFSIFINDIPIHNRKNKSYSLLFADDLVFLGAYNRPKKMQESVSSYLNSLEKWLLKWRLRMSAHKCQHIIFSNGNNSIRDLKLELFGEPIPYEAHPRFLGVTFDRGLTFDEQIKSIKEKCIKRLNIIRIISHKSWRLNKKTLLATYFALVRSIVDYNAFFINVIANNKIDTLQSIQNQAIRSIFKPPPLTNLQRLASQHNVSSIYDRMQSLSDKRIFDSWLKNNPLINQLILEYRSGFEGREGDQTPLSHLKQIIVLNTQLY